MKTNEKLRAEFLKIIKNQIDANDPPETKITYDRLINLGYNETEAKQRIGQCLGVEIFDILKYKKPFNESRYRKNLNQLPKEPFG